MTHRGCPVVWSTVARNSSAPTPRLARSITDAGIRRLLAPVYDAGSAGGRAHERHRGQRVMALTRGLVEVDVVQRPPVALDHELPGRIVDPVLPDEPGERLDQGPAGRDRVGIERPGEAMLPDRRDRVDVA